jgi:hypothetical protein
MQGLMTLWFLAAWIVGTLVVAYVAGQKGRNGLLWAMLSFLLISPLLALIALGALPAQRS